MNQYPKNWKLLSAYIRFVRDSGTCQLCGWKPEDTKALHCAHKNHNKSDCRPSNLWALCHHCHPAGDTQQRLSQASVNYRHLITRSGQLLLFP